MNNLQEKIEDVLNFYQPKCDFIQYSVYAAHSSHHYANPAQFKAELCRIDRCDMSQNLAVDNGSVDLDVFTGSPLNQKISIS